MNNRCEFFNFCLLLVCECVYDVGADIPQHACGSQWVTLSVFYYLYVSSKDGTDVIRLVIQVPLPIETSPWPYWMLDFF